MMRIQSFFIYFIMFFFLCIKILHSSRRDVIENAYKQSFDLYATDNYFLKKTHSCFLKNVSNFWTQYHQNYKIMA